MDMHKIVIEPVLNGFVVRVGCQTLVFESVARLVAGLVRYQASPLVVEREWLANALNNSTVDREEAPGEVNPVTAMATTTANGFWLTSTYCDSTEESNTTEESNGNSTSPLSCRNCVYLYAGVCVAHTGGNFVHGQCSDFRAAEV